MFQIYLFSTTIGIYASILAWSENNLNLKLYIYFFSRVFFLIILEYVGRRKLNDSFSFSLQQLRPNSHPRGEHPMTHLQDKPAFYNKDPQQLVKMWPAPQYSHTNNVPKPNEHQNQQNLKTLGMTSAISMAGMYLTFFNFLFYL